MQYGHSEGDLAGITLNTRIYTSATGFQLASCSQLIRGLTTMRDELSKDPNHHMEESEARMQSDNSDRRKLRERQYQSIDRFDTSGHCVTVFIIVSGKLTAAFCNGQECSTNWQGLSGSL